ncbi:DUF1573 domain-containing protein [Ulvibacter antarcticus]|uniref:Uncharacterized protein DUF1573 n=1 Tax=Ulvibacter antarcticus TaxID=442714 RepID=A0A3L9Z1J6_9FLAO|nr:DUF1573 domain-containing protein [Ulvibacter antarcticus]RMA66394.1 uncharacterized protein DUF1573 [Ulvibacter antarcticus]
MKYLLSIFFIAALATNAFAQNNSKITFDSNKIDLGTIEAGVEKEFTLPFINDGTEPLVIGMIQPSCVCMKVSAPGEAVKPGDKSELKLVFNSYKSGAFNEKIYLQSSGDKKPVLLKISGVVK